MRLTVQRSQEERAGFLGFGKGVRFVAHWQLVLDQQETALVDKYGLQAAPLTRLVNPDKPDEPFEVKLHDLFAGYERESADVWVLRDYIDELSAACRELGRLMRDMRDFAGVQTLDIEPC